MWTLADLIKDDIQKESGRRENKGCKKEGRREVRGRGGSFVCVAASVVAVPKIGSWRGGLLMMSGMRLC